jgi:hypothetical protein
MRLDLVDSDCFFHRPTDVSKVFSAENKPIFYYGDFGDDLHWKEGSEDVLGRSLPYHTMRRQGMCFAPRHLQLLREDLLYNFRENYNRDVEFDRLVLERWDKEGDWSYPKREGIQYHCSGKPTMSEFLVMGGFVWNYHYHDYEWRKIPKDAGWPHPPPDDAFVRQYWSHSGVTDEIRAEMERCLA